MPWSPEAYYVGKVPVILMKSRQDILKEAYRLEKHVEGGFFSEIYSAPFAADGRSFAGSIYFLLRENEISHLHVIDCDEVWYYHEGEGMRITQISTDGKVSQSLLGPNASAGQRMMVFIPAGTMFAARNLEGQGEGAEPVCPAEAGRHRIPGGRASRGGNAGACRRRKPRAHAGAHL